MIEKDVNLIPICMQIEEEVAIICSVFPNAASRVCFNATAMTIIDKDGDTDEGYYLNGNIVMSLRRLTYTMVYHEFGHYLASLFPEDEFKRLATQCYKELRVTPYNRALKVYSKEHRPEEAFCLKFQLTMDDPNKRNNAFIQMLKARYAAVSEECEGKWEEFVRIRDALGGKTVGLTGRVFYHIPAENYNAILAELKRNPACAGFVELLERFNKEN